MAISTSARVGTRVSIPWVSANRSALSAGMTVLLVYMFAGLPVHIGVLTQLGLSADDATKWFFITWLTTGLFSVTLSLLTKQPISINLSIPALVFLAGAGSGFSLPQILGANLVVGVVAIGLSVFRLTDAFARLVPTQVAIGVFVGSMFGFMLKTSSLAATDLAVAGPTVLGFVLTLAATRSHLLAVAIAAASGLLAVSVFGDVPAFANSGALPQVGLPSIEMDPAAMVALGIPLLVLTAGVGNVQALAILRSEGYRIKGNLLGLAAGISTVVNALGGGHPAAIGGTTIAVSAGPGAGPRAFRYWAVVVSSIPVVAIAVAAVPVLLFVQDLPVSYTLSVGALALVAPFTHMLRRTMDGPQRMAALVALVVAATPLSALGMPMAFWALLAGTAIVAVKDWSLPSFLRPASDST